MIKNNLPVILLKGLVLLPQGDARIELNNDISKKIIDISKLYHNNEVLIVTPINELEESPDTTDLPKVGVIAKITSRIDLPNGNTRIVLSGQKRVKVLSYVNYSNESDVLESIFVTYRDEDYNEIEETALLRKLIGELDKYIGANPYISNSILNNIKGITDLDKLTDKIANFLPLNLEKKISLMLDMSRVSRTKKLITEINIELAVLELENKIEIEFRKNLDQAQKELILKEKLKIIKEELGEKDNKTEYIEKIKELLKSGRIPTNIISRARRELERYEVTPEISPELGVIRNYLDYLTKIPWGIYTKDETNLKKIESSLNSSHYGLTEIKNRIIEYIAVKENKKSEYAPIICLIGPPGVGKTTLASSIANALKKNFAKISLGGINDPAELLGHRKTYIGSCPGKIVNALIKSKSMNSVILLDEIDKLSDSYKGDTSSSLLDILDSNQNKTFIDNFIEEEINLSSITWIITANDKSTIPAVLLDRLEIIDITSYIKPEKLEIAKKHLIPTSLLKVGLTPNQIKIPENILENIIDNYTKESGVRELERLIDKIIRKVITAYKLENKSINNIIINPDDLKKYLKSEKYNTRKKGENIPGFLTGLAYTPYGGETLEVEVTSYKGENKFITSGSLGKVLEESIKISLSYIKSKTEYFKLKENDLNKTFHINFREIGTPKDGPSAGTLITTCLLSHILNKSIPKNISMTGEITLLGEVLPVGGIREKVMAAIREGIDILYISVYNKREIDELDDYLKNKIKFKIIKNYKEIYVDLFERSDNSEFHNRKQKSKNT